MSANFDTLLDALYDQPTVPVCPYTGLRTFTEDETLFFRGREHHVQRCAELLATQHFLMITGASGDGKSSLVYAGLLPEIRAGLFGGRYGRWVVCAFRPERQPLRQMAGAVAAGLHLTGSEQAVETELGNGFAALVQLYQNSRLVPPAEAAATAATQLPADGANLLLIVDQFEEFFTNADNYVGDVPAAPAQVVVNLLVETTRLAREQQLPIYVLCTMRSDYVGQCADFRGLVELIGESQYFVPRLRRPEFVEVIRKPALLGGNRIAERLVQRLIDDNRTGHDQLPVLQHALLRIWQAAQQGGEELDLIHYAMVGGLPAEEIPWEDKRRFDAWRNTISYAQQERLLLGASLHNVLDAHADQLYADAAAIYNQDFQPALLPATAARIIELTFRSLTKLDGQRVVRNRLTGAEITAIINDPALPWPVVCRVLRPFRQPGNTFLSPFLYEGDDDHLVLPPATVLDITHESLIRNWQRLASWARSEANDVRTMQQLADQATAWAAHGHDRGYLLPIGPYTRFAKWYARKQPSASWLAYYAVDDGKGRLDLAAAEARHELLEKYLAESRRHLRFSLVVARYGVGRLVTWVVGPLLLLAALWGGWWWQQRQDNYVAYDVLRTRLPLLTSAFIPVSEKADLLIAAHRLRHVAYQPGLDDSTRYHFATLLDGIQVKGVPDDILALDCELAMYDKANNVGYDRIQAENPLVRPLLLDLGQRLARADSRLATFGSDSVRQRQRLAVRTSQAIMAFTHYLAYTVPNPLLPGRPPLLAHSQADSTQVAAEKQRLLARLHGYVRREVAATAGPAPNAINFWFCTQVLLGQGNFKPTELSFFRQLKPQRHATKGQFNRFYPLADRKPLAVGEPRGRAMGFYTYMIAVAAMRPRNASRQLLACADSLDSYTTQDTVYRLDPVLPYLLKYEVGLNDSLPRLLRRPHALTANFASLVFYLLSAAPAARPTSLVQHNAALTPSTTYNNVYADRVSYSIPLATRDRAWQAIGRLLPRLRQDRLFEPDAAPDTAANRLFLEAFYNKYRGCYLHELRHSARDGDACFTRFEQCLNQLRQRKSHRLSLSAWNGDGEYVVRSALDPSMLDFLRHPGRPASLNWEWRNNFTRGNSYLPPFTSFYRHRLRVLNKEEQPDRPHQVRWLDSVVFAEAALPGRYVLPRWGSVLEAKMARPEEPQADSLGVNKLNSIVDITSYPDRAQCNRVLLMALKIPRNRTEIKGVGTGLKYIQEFGTYWAGHRQLIPEYVGEPLQMVLSDLAVAAVADNPLETAFRIANLLPDSAMRTATRIRVAEQAMLNENSGNLEELDNWLKQYGAFISQNPKQVPANIVAVLSWRGGRFAELAELLTKEGNNTVVGTNTSTFEGFVLPLSGTTVAGTGIGALCLGQTLAGDGHAAVRAVPAYVAEQRRQNCFNLILTGLARRSQYGAWGRQRLDALGWQQYDEAVLKGPREYTLPSE